MRIRNLAKIEKVVLAVAIIEPLTTVPQLYTIWIERQTTGVSLLTWVLYAFCGTIWAIYGLHIKNLPVILSGLLWALFEVLVVIGLLIY